jgi:hypothetical protein
MPRDSVVDEVRRARDQHAARFNYDLCAIAKDAQKRERKSGHKVVSRTRRRSPVTAK